MQAPECTREQALRNGNFQFQQYMHVGNLRHEKSQKKRDHEILAPPFPRLAGSARCMENNNNDNNNNDDDDVGPTLWASREKKL